MAEIVSLRKARKEAKKRTEAERAATNRAIHGRSKAERETNKDHNKRLNRLLDGHRIETGDS